MEVGNLTVSNLDAALLIVWLLISIAWNKLAAIMLLELSAYIGIQAVTETDFQAFTLCSTLYFYISASNIRISKEFRQAFFCFAVIYFCGAIDHFIYSHLHDDTGFDKIQPFLITFVNAYVLAYLLGGGRRDNVNGLADYCAKCAHWFKLHIPNNR